jgi:hypothetical protein
VVSRRWWWLTLATSVLSACTQTPASVQPTTSLPPAEVHPRTTATTPVTAAPQPTGVPGLTAADPFCSAWAGYVGTLQALGTAASFGGLTSDGFAMLELAAAPRLVEAAAAIDQAWPPELSSERDVAIEQRIGPYTRRAQHAIDALTNAGVTAAELGTLSADWQKALLARDPNTPVIELPPQAADLQAELDAAAATYNAAVTPFAQDPSLVVDAVETPETDAYLLAHCPDLASSGVGDAI